MGDRSHRTAFAFCADLAHRVKRDLQITTDGHPAYQWAIGANFKRANYARLVKVYGKDSQTGRGVVVDARKEAVFGTPDMKKASTSYAERSNLTCDHIHALQFKCAFDNACRPLPFNWHCLR